MRKINDSFKCKNCGHVNMPAKKTCRNHCARCLYSLHVDMEIPGDRECDCHSLMAPIAMEKSGKKGIMIIHECLKCRKIQKNKAADDDNINKIIEISTYGR